MGNSLLLHVALPAESGTGLQLAWVLSPLSTSWVLMLNVCHQCQIRWASEALQLQTAGSFYFFLSFWQLAYNSGVNEGGVSYPRDGTEITTVLRDNYLVSDFGLAGMRNEFLIVMSPCTSPCHPRHCHSGEY